MNIKKLHSCTKIGRPNGTFYTVEYGKSFSLQPGEKVIGKAYNCGEIIQLNRISKPNLQDELSNELGIGFGDVLKRLAKPFATAMGRKGCSSCEARRLITNAYAQLKAKYGQLEAAKIIKDLWMLSFKANGDEVLIALKAKLHD